MNYRISSITPLSERRAIIGQRYKESEEFGEPIYEFRGKTYKPKLIELPIDLPVYRMENCRAFSAQQTEIARSELKKDFFVKGQESVSAQAMQHKILAKLAEQSIGSVTPISEVLEKEGQRETILVSSSGVVVNGNRRLCAMRELLHQQDGSVDRRFEYVRCSVLPSDTTRDEIDDIEADLQARPETRLDYDWIGDARLVQRQVNKGRTSKEVADRLHRRKSDIDNVLQALEEADLYLREWVEKPGEYVLVQEGEQFFNDIVKAISRQNPDQRDASRAVAWCLFYNRDDISGRLYRFNSAFGDLAPKTIELLKGKLDIRDDEQDTAQPVDDVGDEDFFVDFEKDVDTLDHSAIIQSLRDNKGVDEITEAVVSSCETAIELDRGQKSERATLKTLEHVNSKVSGIDATMAGRGTLPAILKQIQSIRTVLSKIEIRVNERLKDDDVESDTDVERSQ